MGHPDNLTNSTFGELAKKWNKTVEEVKLDVYNALVNKTVDKNPDLKNTFVKASQAWGQTVEEAQQQTLHLLKHELKE